MEFSPEIIEAAVLAATTGQFGTQVVYESFKLSIDALSDAKKQAFLHICSGIVALTAYIITQSSFVAKAGLLAFISGMFAEAVLKLLKKKNEGAKDKTEELAAKLHELDIKDRDEKIQALEEKVKLLEQHSGVSDASK